MDIENILKMLAGLFVAIYFAYELRCRRKLREEELTLQKNRFDVEKAEREERLRWLARETARIKDVASLLGDYIVAQLKEDVRWASQALERAKIKPRVQSVFADRLGHFREEKEHLAANFIPQLLTRCKAFAESGKQVYLLIDSGTTLYELFEVIGRESVRFYENRDEWIGQLRIVTNNLPGIDALTETGRVNPQSRYSSLAIEECHLLPGKLLPIYSAVTGEKTNEALKRLREETDQNKAVFIGLVAGNWIRLRRTDPVCPVPLARGIGHLDFKQALINNSDEIYVITPLGKIFIGVSLDDINTALGFIKDSPVLDRQSYGEVVITEKAASVKLVSTSRPPNCVLSNLSERIKWSLGDVSERLPINGDVSDHILYPFNISSNEWSSQIEIEFPHSYTRRREFMEKFFFVPHT